MDGTFCVSGPTRDTTPPAPKCGCVHVRDYWELDNDIDKICHVDML